MNKIKKISELAGLVAELKLKGKNIVLAHGVFDLVHPGHIRHLEAARREGDTLVVTITPDKYVNKGPGRPFFPQHLRAEVIASLSQVDYVAINDWPTAIETITAIKPNIYVKGSDYEDHSKDLTGNISKEEQALKDIGGRIVFTKDIVFSSTSLLNNFFNIYSEEAFDFLKDFRKRINVEKIVANVGETSKCKTLVIGDTIIDEYHYCSPLAKSQKENVIVTKYLSDENFAGGVLAAANHVASLCDQVDLITCLGKEKEKENFVRSKLKANVNLKLYFNDNSPTTVKRRFVEPSYMRKLFEVCFLNEEKFTVDKEDSICSHLDSVLPEYDLVLVTDFGHGLMTPRIIDLVCRKAKFLAVNVQTNSANLGFNLVTKYPHADYICIDEPEARLAFHDKTSDIETIIKRLSNQLEARFVTVTHGGYGCYVYSKDDGIFRIPVFTRDVVDTVGAGDAFLSISSPCVAMGMPMEQVGFVGNAAGALKVRIVGNRSSVEKAPLLKFITALLK